MNSLKVTVAMLGARMHYAVPRLLFEAGFLDRFFTDSYVGNKPLLREVLRRIPSFFRPDLIARWLDRKSSALSPAKVKSFEWLGIWYSIARIRAGNQIKMECVYLEAARRFNKKIVEFGLGDAHIVWGFNGAALELFEQAKKERRFCILEQTILPRTLERRLLAEEYKRWRVSEKNDVNFSLQLPMDGREESEWLLADKIVAGSSFVRDGLLEMGVPESKISVIPYGVDMQNYSRRCATPFELGMEIRPLRVLFAGEVGLRKGVLDLLGAVKLFKTNEIELRLAGGFAISDKTIAEFTPCAEFLGQVPRSQMSNLFNWADVFVLPSIVEGSATVTYEAIMAGCPVITTPNSGSIIRDGVDGFIVPIRSPDSIVRALRRYLDEPGLLHAHRIALEKTKLMASLDRYKADLVELVQMVGMQLPNRIPKKTENQNKHK